MTRIVAFWPFLEFVTGATGEGEVEARGAAQGPPPTRAGGQDDGSYTNSLKPGLQQKRDISNNKTAVIGKACDCIYIL